MTILVVVDSRLMSTWEREEWLDGTWFWYLEKLLVGGDADAIEDELAVMAVTT